MTPCKGASALTFHTPTSVRRWLPAPAAAGPPLAPAASPLQRRKGKLGALNAEGRAHMQARCCCEVALCSCHVREVLLTSPDHAMRQPGRCAA